MPSAEEIINQAQRWEKLGERQARETRRTVYRVDGRYTVKHFELPAALETFRAPWRIEEQALRRLAGRFAPRCYGHVEKVDRGLRSAWLVKEYVPGSPVASFTPEDMPQVATLMAGLHRNGVVTDDASAANFLRTGDGRFLFLDLGRALLFERHGASCRVAIGRELAKLRREGFGWNTACWRAFAPPYFASLGTSRAETAFVTAVMRGAIALRMARKTLKGQSCWR